MDVALYHNPNAGLQAFTMEDVARLLRDERHEVHVFTKGDHPADAAIAADPEVIIAAGGDGTIAPMAKALWRHRSSIPLYMLPLGTANNIAWSLGFTAAVPRLVRELATAREATFDIGLITAGEREALFVEAAGVGFFGAALHDDVSVRAQARRVVRHATHPHSSVDAKVQDGAHNVAQRIRHAPTLRYEVLADGADLSGDYISITAMNIRSIGPRMLLAPDASSVDGLLDLVLVRPEARDALATLVESREAVRAPTIDCHRVRDVELSWQHGHLDDDPWPKSGALASDRRAQICISGRVRLLLP